MTALMKLSQASLKGISESNYMNNLKTVKFYGVEVYIEKRSINNSELFQQNGLPDDETLIVSSVNLKYLLTLVVFLCLF